MADFRKRSAAPEIMDDLQCSGEVVTQTLRELDMINALLGGNKVTLEGLAHLIPPDPPAPLAVADLGCGGGGLLRLMRKWSDQRRLKVALTGFDANPFIVGIARRHTSPDCGIAYEALDIFSDSFRKRSFDIVTGTLFFHHFSNEQLIHFFRQLRHQLRVGLVINDIHRHWMAYYSIRWLTRMFSRSAMVRYDAPLSVLRAFRRHELEEILHAAGFSDFTIRWKWAFRWQVIARVNEKVA